MRSSLHLSRSLVLAFVVVVASSVPSLAAPPGPERASARGQQLSIDGVCARPGSLRNRCGDYGLLAETRVERLLRAHRTIDAGHVDKAMKERERIEKKLREMTSGGIVEELR